MVARLGKTVSGTQKSNEVSGSLRTGYRLVTDSETRCQTSFARVLDTHISDKQTPIILATPGLNLARPNLPKTYHSPFCQKELINFCVYDLCLCEMVEMNKATCDVVGIIFSIFDFCSVTSPKEQRFEL